MGNPPVRNTFPPMAMADAPPFDRIREFYLYQEPSLLTAIRSGDRREAVRLVNHLLVHIYSVGEERNELLKGLLLELVVMISRAAVEAGASQTEILGMRFAHLAELAEIEDDEALSGWLRRTLERIFVAMERQQRCDVPVLVTASLDYLRRHLDRDLSRDDLARHVGVSAGHLSQLLKERTGRSFVEMLREVRVQAAAELLLETDQPLAEVAAACGFCDQSYMTHVFRDLRGMTPKQYRDRTRAGAAAKQPPD
ncbi:MAG: AraC family transcriptional regulator [Akkermansiaceae bacterium]|nr:AraC family transcriptional regulator [Akkermansiaceae bacterium]MCF7731425.1 AraC family transcriptional regulator [Akkermansiaceae bacterium]